MSTHRIVQQHEVLKDVAEQGSAYSVGTITQFCSSSGEHYVVFDDCRLQPQWIILQKSTADVLFGFEDSKTSCHTIIAAAPHESSVSESEPLTLLPQQQQQQVEHEFNTLTTIYDSSNSKHTKKHKQLILCLLCKGDTVLSSKQVDSNYYRTSKHGSSLNSFKSCSICTDAYHTYCMPKTNDLIADKKDSHTWTCLKCTGYR